MDQAQAPLVDESAVRIHNVWNLLLYAWDLARWCGRWDGEAEMSTNLNGLLARVLVDCTQLLLRHQLARAYTDSASEIRGIRGRIDFARSLKRLCFESGTAACVYPELTADNLRNRILRSTLHRLSRDQSLEFGTKPHEAKELRHALRASVRAMDGVKLQAIHASDFSRLQLGRNDSAYALPMAICRLLARHETPSEQSGRGLFAHLARDEIAFQELFERFVRNFLRIHRADLRVEAQELSWFDELGSKFVPRMRTDITVEWVKPIPRRLVIDTKYYGNALSARFRDSEKFHSSNLYQLYAYLRTQEHRGGPHRDACGMLLYPVTNKRLDERMRVQGHEIRVATIDLARPWMELEHNLLQLLEPDDKGKAQPVN